MRVRENTMNSNQSFRRFLAVAGFAALGLTQVIQSQAQRTERPSLNITGYVIDAFAAEMHIKVPQGMRVFASGAQGASHAVKLSSGKPGDQFDFNWTKSGFPGTVIAGRYVNPISVGAGNIKVYLTVSHQQSANELAQTATKEYEYFTDNFGAPETS